MITQSWIFRLADYILDKVSMKNFIGWTAAILLLVAYFLISFNFLKSHDLIYNILNLLGGTGLAWRVWQDRNYSNFVLEIIFIIIALKAIFF